MRLKTALLTTSMLAFGFGGIAHAEDATAADKADTLEQIIVYAQKRPQTYQKTPVIETVIAQSTIEQLQVTSTEDVARVAPGLVANTGLGLVALEASIRGIGSVAGNPAIDPSVILNIDGMSLASGLALSVGMFDLGQIEVLKGPQSLFFGKSTTGGVIALRTADPTDKFEVIGRASYDFESLAPKGELIVSGPLGDDFRVRLAGMYSTSEGYFNLVGMAQGASLATGPQTSLSIPSGGLTPPYDRGPKTRDYITRATVLWNPDNDMFDARLKVDFAGDRADFNQVYELESCPNGTGPAVLGPGFTVPFIGSNDKCTLGRDIHLVAMDPTYFPGIANGGVPYTDTTQKHTTFELNFRPTDHFTLTSLTGYNLIEADSLISVAATSGAGSPIAVETPLLRRRNFSEELRLNSYFSSSLNFTIGGLYEDNQIHEIDYVRVNRSPALLPPALLSLLPPIISGDESIVDTKVYSVFGQLRYDVTDQVELDGGMRYTDEKKAATVFDRGPFTPGQIKLPVSEIEAKNVAPEFTVSYLPTEDLTFFGSYKIAYKSGGFATGFAPPAGLSTAFGEEKAKGGEVGLKSRWLAGQLAVNLAGYDYTYTGLQVSYNVYAPALGQYLPLVANAGSAISEGIDVDFAYHPRAIEGLTLHGAVNWNYGRYSDLKGIPCYGGQTIAAGCTGGPPDPITGFNTTQDVSGTQLIRGAEWQGNFGAEYLFPVANDYDLIFAGNILFSSSYPDLLAASGSRNDIFQEPYAKLDLGVTLKAPNDRWEISLLVKNVTDTITQSISLGNVQYGATPGTEITGSTGRGPGGVDEALGFPQPGRAIFLGATLRFGDD